MFGFINAGCGYVRMCRKSDAWILSQMMSAVNDALLILAN
jgi:hypothetical protein